MDIQNLINAKRKQIAVLERHIRMLEQMAAEEERFSGNSSPSPTTAAGSRSTGARTRGGRQGASYVEMIAAYLKSHPGRQRGDQPILEPQLRPIGERLWSEQRRR